MIEMECIMAGKVAFCLGVWIERRVRTWRDFDEERLLRNASGMEEGARTIRADFFLRACSYVDEARRRDWFLERFLSFFEATRADLALALGLEEDTLVDRFGVILADLARLDFGSTKKIKQINLI